MMIAAALGLLAATSLQTTRFGPYENVVVERIGSEPVISAYGDAHVVRLHGSDAEVGACLSGIRSGKATDCEFRHSGSIEFRPLGGGYRFTFADAPKVNIVDFVVDAAGLERALGALGSLR